MMQTIIIAKAVLLDDQGNVLLLRRSQTDPDRPGGYDFPGGAVDPGEDITAGLMREIAEEAGLEVQMSQCQLFFTHTEIKEAENRVRLLFLVKIKKPEVKLSYEHDKFEFLETTKVLDTFHHPIWNTGLRYGIENSLLR